MSKKKEYTYLKRLPEGAEFPDDFWNYSVNHITGYFIEPNRDWYGKEVERKYAVMPKPDPTNTA